MKKRDRQALEAAQLAAAAAPAVELDARRFHPFGDLVLIRYEPETQRGSILLPQNVKTVVLPIAEVLELGPDVKKPLKKGQRVMFSYRDARFLDGKIGLVEEKHVVAGVDPESVIETRLIT